MLEDTLQTVRTTYRLIIAISALTLVFALTLDYPAKKQAQVEQIQALLAYDFSDSQDFAKQRVELFNKENIHPLAKRIEDTIKARDYQFLLLDDLFKPLYYPPDVYSFKAFEYIKNKKDQLSFKALPMASLIAMLVKLSLFEGSFLLSLFGYCFVAGACNYLQATTHKHLADIRSCIH